MQLTMGCNGRGNHAAEAHVSQRSPDAAELAKRNPGSARTPRIPAFGLHPGYHLNSRTEKREKRGQRTLKGRMMLPFSVYNDLTKACSGRR